MGVKENAEKWKNFMNSLKIKAGLNETTIVRLWTTDSNHKRHELKNFEDFDRLAGQQQLLQQSNEQDLTHIFLTLHLDVLANSFDELKVRYQEALKKKQ